MQLHRQLGISYNAAWRMKHKLMQMVLERGDTQRLSCMIKLDDAYLGSERSGGQRGREAEGKTLFVVAVQTTDECRPGVEEPQFWWVNTVLGNLKSALRSTYHSFEPKYAQRYLAEFEYRFNRYYRLPDLIPRCAWVALRMPPMPEKLLKLGLS